MTYAHFSIVLVACVLFKINISLSKSIAAEVTIVATDLSAIIYQPPLNDSTWEVKSLAGTKEASSMSTFASATFQFEGTSISLLANPKSFNVSYLSITFDTIEAKLDVRNVNKSTDEDGLFAFYTSDNFFRSGLHSIMIQKEISSPQGIWNLVSIKYTPESAFVQSSRTLAPIATSVLSVASVTQTSDLETIPAKSSHEKLIGVILGSVGGFAIFTVLGLIFKFYRQRRIRISHPFTNGNDDSMDTMGAVNILGSIRPNSLLWRVRYSKETLPVYPERENKLGTDKNLSRISRSALRKRKKHIDLQIQEVQSSVVALRARSETSAPKSAANEASLVENLCERIAGLEIELEALREERQRLQQVVDSLETETLPGYDEGL